MSVFACQELPVDFLQAPLAPVVTCGNSVSVNPDNYNDTDVGLEQLAAADWYPNVPPIAFFNTVHTVASAAEFGAAYAAALPGDAIIISDGAYNWGELTYLDKAFTIDDPVYILAETPGGVVFSSGTTFGFRVSNVGHIVGGFTIDSTANISTAIIEAYTDPCSHLRVTSCTFPSTTAENYPISVYGNCYSMVGLEVDNCAFDSQDSATNTNTHIRVPTRDPSLVSTTGNPRFVRLHHNTHANMSNASGEAAPIIVGLAWQMIDPADGYNPYNNQIGVIIENCTFDSCKADDEQIEIKSGSSILRYNLIIDGGDEAGLTLRLGDGCLIYGNWAENVGKQGVRLSGRDTATVFNYFGTSNSATPALSMHGYAVSLTNADRWGYIPCDRASVRYNVFTRFLRVARNIDDGDRVRNMEGVVISDNIYYSSVQPQSDAVGNGNYLDSAGDYPEASFRAENDWGTNSYSTTDLAVTKAKTEGLFTGPGTVFAVPAPAAVYGQPTELHAPSWWV